jgi:hypothetical protein
MSAVIYYSIPKRSFMKLHATFTLALLLSLAPQFSHAFKSDLDHCQTEEYSYRLSLDGLKLTSDDNQAFVVLLSNKILIPDNWNGKFGLKDRITKEVIKNRFNAHVTHDSLNLDVEVPAGQLSIISNDEALEVLYYVAQDLIEKKSAGDVLKDAGKVYVTEKIVAAALWLLSNSNVEALLPDAITRDRVYQFLRTEIARYGAENFIARINNNVK